MSLLFALISQTKQVTTSELHSLVAPAELNARDCARAWSLEPPAIVLCDKVSELPFGCIAVVFVSDDTDQGAIAVHFPGGYSRVHVDRTSSLAQGPDSVLEALGHELCEALVDPGCDLWMPHPTRAGIEIAKEVCDPVQSVYSNTLKGVSWPAANFVLPRYFAAPDPNSSAEHCFDFGCELEGPGRVGPSGYVILRRKNDRGGYDEWLEGPDGENPQLSTAKQNGLRYTHSRTARRTGTHYG